MTQIKQFDITSLFERRVPSIIIIGRRDTGKTVLICDILNHYTKNQEIGRSFQDTVITGTNRDIYTQYTQNIYDEYKPSIIENVLKLKGVNQNNFLVLDNCMYDTSWVKNTFMRSIIINGFIWKLMMILSLDYPVSITPMLRDNITYIFILRESDYKIRKRIWENYTNIFPSFESFCSILDDLPNFHCLVIKKCYERCDLYDQIFTYQAEIP